MQKAASLIEIDCRIPVWLVQANELQKLVEAKKNKNKHYKQILEEARAHLVSLIYMSEILNVQHCN